LDVEILLYLYGFILKICEFLVTVLSGLDLSFLIEAFIELIVQVVPRVSDVAVLST
jgi:hypothetical protein